MKKVLLSSFILMALTFISCGSKKSAADNYYNNPQRPTHTTRTEIKKSRIEQLADVDNGYLRVVGSATDYEKADARRDAIRDAQIQMATLLENAISGITDEYRKKASVNKKKFTEKEMEEHYQTEIAQVLKNCRIVDSQAYNVSDGTIEYEVCLELGKPTKEVIKDVYDDLSREGILGVDYDKEKYVKDNMDRIKQNREKLYENK